MFLFFQQLNNLEDVNDMKISGCVSVAPHTYGYIKIGQKRGLSLMQKRTRIALYTNTLYTCMYIRI